MNMNQKKVRFWGILLVIVLVASLLLSACAQPTPSASTPVTLTIADALQPSSLDIAIEYEAAAMAVNRVVYERLVRYKGDTTEIEPELATSWDISTDGKEYTFHLREGVKFHDGTPFNA